MATVPKNLVVLFALLGAVQAEEQDRTLGKVQHILGQAKLLETRSELDGALSKIEEAEAVLAEWRASIAGKIRAGAAAEPAEGAPAPEEPIDFSMNQTFIPEQCPRRTQLGSTLKIHYVGKLLVSGKVFASSFHSGSMPVKFTLGSGDVVEGWNRGLLGMCTGERRRLLVPHTLGYGGAGSKGVPPNSNLR